MAIQSLSLWPCSSPLSLRPTPLMPRPSRISCSSSAQFAASTVDKRVQQIQKSGVIAYLRANTDRTRSCACCTQRWHLSSGDFLLPPQVVHQLVQEQPSVTIGVYPVSALGGVRYISALKKPFAHIPIVASQGISMDSMLDYILGGASAVVLSDAIFDKEAMN